MTITLSSDKIVTYEGKLSEQTLLSVTSRSKSFTMTFGQLQKFCPVEANELWAKANG